MCSNCHSKITKGDISPDEVKHKKTILTRGKSDNIESTFETQALKFKIEQEYRNNKYKFENAEDYRTISKEFVYTLYNSLKDKVLIYNIHYKLNWNGYHPSNDFSQYRIDASLKKHSICFSWWSYYEYYLHVVFQKGEYNDYDFLEYKDISRVKYIVTISQQNEKCFENPEGKLFTIDQLIEYWFKVLINKHI